MVRKTGLGRGLDALLPDEDEAGQSISQIAITELDCNPEQPRRNFSDEELQSLSESIKSAGVLQPLLVTENNGRYRIVAGERRFRAARLAGLDKVPCIVRDFSYEEQLEAALIENIQREDLNAIEEANAVRQLMVSCNYTQEQAATRLGKSRPAVANLLRLLTLPEEIQQYVTKGFLSAGHARVLAGLNSTEQQVELAEKAIAEGLSVRELEALAAQPVAEEEQKEIKPAVRELPLELQDMQKRLCDTFGVRATIRGNAKKGRIILQYANADELDQLYACLERLEN